MNFTSRMIGQCKLSVMFILQTGSLVTGEFMLIPGGMLGLDCLHLYGRQCARCFESIH